MAAAVRRRRGPLAIAMLAAAWLLGCATTASSPEPDVATLMRRSFRPAGIATLDRLEQSPLQKACTEHAGAELPAQLRRQLEQLAAESIRYPADGNYIGDWKRGEIIAQSGIGMQFSDNQRSANGGNCYACHQLSKAELAYGNIGPSLHNYGKQRGSSEPILRYTWGRLWNAHAYNACNVMPRFGAAGILTEQQLKDVMALLLDPASPVNR